MQYLFQHELQALELLPVISEVSPMMIKIIIEENTAMRGIILVLKREIHYSCIEKEVCLFSLTVINAPNFYVFNSSSVYNTWTFITKTCLLQQNKIK